MTNMNCSPDTYKEAHLRLVQGFDELVKTFKTPKNKNEATEIYATNIQEVVDVYETEMSKLFVNNFFLKDMNFEKYYIKNWKSAWQLLKAKTPGACDGDKFYFNKAITSVYLKFKQINKDNREGSQVNTETEQIDDYIDFKNKCFQ